jgi:hypothetical protein
MRFTLVRTFMATSRTVRQAKIEETISIGGVQGRNKGKNRARQPRLRQAHLAKNLLRA